MALDTGQRGAIRGWRADDLALVAMGSGSLHKTLKLCIPAAVGTVFGGVVVALLMLVLNNWFAVGVGDVIIQLLG